MKQQEFLFELIHNLSKSEKRYFKLLSNRSSGSKSYLKLFEQVEQQKSYDEGKLLKKNKTDKRTFAVSKNYLQEQILKSLRNFHEGMSVKSRIHALLLNVEILFQKGLIRPSYKELKKARNLASKHQKFGLLQEVLNWERQFSSISEKPERDEAEIAQDEKSILERQRNVLQYQSLYHRLLEFKKQQGYIRGKSDEAKIEKIMSHNLMQDETKALSERAKYFFHLTYTNYYYIKGEFGKEYEHSIQILQLDHSAIDEYEQLNAILNHIPSAFFVNHNAEVLQYIDLARDLVTNLSIGKFEYIVTQVFYYRTVYKIASFVKTGNFDEVSKTLLEAEEEFPHYERHLNNEWKGIMMEMMALTYFLMEKPKKALQWSNQLLLTSNRNTRLDVYVAVRILNLLALVELKDYQTLNYSTNSTYRSLQMLNKKEQSFEVELEIVRALKKVPSLVSYHEFKAWAQKLETRINQIQKKEDKHATNEYDYILKWLKSRIEGTSLTEVMKANASALEPLVSS